MHNNYCSMIHGGLLLTFKLDSLAAGHCCLRNEGFLVNANSNFWNDIRFDPLRKINISGEWDPGCNNCQQLENIGNFSMRQGMNQGLGIYSQTNISGPARIDLMFDISCNLACRTCGPHSSTYWKKQLNHPVTIPRTGQEIISALSNIDLSNLRQLVFCGGETLLGQEYWTVASWLADNVPNAKEQLTLCFQTNGTQPILLRNYNTIEKVHLVKLHISIDGTKERFEYLRWPANWQQVTENILTLRDSLPSNVMFVVEETISIFNALYYNEVNDWVAENFSTNREGDIVNHTKHLAVGLYSLSNMSHEYVENISQTPYKSLILDNWTENVDSINQMMLEIQRFDQQRNQKFSEIFPEVAKFYRRFM